MGITAIELAEGKPPYADIHPMRAIFMIPSKPPPSFRDLNKWSSDFIDFVNQCLVKNPQNRATATDLLEHSFIKNSKTSPQILRSVIDEANALQEARKAKKSEENMLNEQLRKQLNLENLIINNSGEEYDTFKFNKTNDDDTIKVQQSQNCGDTSYNTIIELDSSVNTMVINESSESDDFDDSIYATETSICTDESTIKVNATNSKTLVASAPTMLISDHGDTNQNEFMKHFSGNSNNYSVESSFIDIQNEVKNFENDVNFINKLSVDEIETRLRLLDIELAKEIEVLSKKYDIKRQPIMNAIEMKKKKPQIF